MTQPRFSPTVEALDDCRCPAQLALQPPEPIFPPEPTALLHLGDHVPEPVHPSEPV
jgi:hypothetical protein